MSKSISNIIGITTRIWCENDDCSDLAKVEIQSTRSATKEVIAKAKEHGWVLIDRALYCPACAELKKKEAS